MECIPSKRLDTSYRYVIAYTPNQVLKLELDSNLTMKLLLGDWICFKFLSKSNGTCVRVYSKQLSQQIEQTAAQKPPLSLFWLRIFETQMVIFM